MVACPGQVKLCYKHPQITGQFESGSKQDAPVAFDRPSLKPLSIYYRYCSCFYSIYLLKKPDQFPVKMSTLYIWPVASSLYCLMCSSLLCTSCKLVVSSKNLMKLRSDCITSGGTITFIDVKIDSGFRYGQPDSSITKLSIYLLTVSVT